MLEHADLGARQQRRQRHAAADAFAERHDVRLHAVMLVAEQGAEAPHPGLHLIANQQQLVLVAQRAQAGHEFGRRAIDAAFTLHRFEHHGHGFVRDQGIERGQVIELRLREARHLGSEHHVPARLARRRHGGDGTAMEAVDRGDDLEGAAFVLPAPLARQLDRAFVGFGAAVGEEHAMEAGMCGQQVGQPDRGFVVERRAGRDQFRCLGHQCLDDALGRVPERIDRPALHEIEVLLAVVVPQPGTFALDKNEFGPRGDVHQGLDREIFEVHDNNPLSE